MAKFTNGERHLVKELIAIHSLKHLSDKEIIEIIFQHTNKMITDRALYDLRQSIKRDSFQWFNTLRQDRYAYIHEYKERINEITDLQKKVHEIIDKNEHNPQIQLTAIGELHKLNITLSNYVEIIPNIIGNNSNGSTVPTNPQDKTISTETEEQFITV